MEKDAIGEKSNVISRCFKAIEPARSGGLHRFVEVFGHKIEQILKLKVQLLRNQLMTVADKNCLCPSEADAMRRALLCNNAIAPNCSGQRRKKESQKWEAKLGDIVRRNNYVLELKAVLANLDIFQNPNPIIRIQRASRIKFSKNGKVRPFEHRSARSRRGCSSRFHRHCNLLPQKFAPLAG